MKPINIADVLRYVHQETGFLDHFEHVLPVQPKGHTRMDDFMAVIIGNGTNYGVYGIANISDRSYSQLRSTQANYVRPETLPNANDAINNATAKLAIYKHYSIQEDLIHASADGQKSESRLETFKTRYSSKYFGTNKGVSAVTLVANHAAVNAKIIGSNAHESRYIFDLLQSNTSVIKPDILSTDTHGVNHVNFALLDLFGYGFAPRYAKMGKVISDMFNVDENKKHGIKLSLKKPIKTDIIVNQWDTIQRIVISLQERSTTQATLIRKLSGYSKNHPLLQALTEYNRMIKATYLFEYIDDESLRGYVQRTLNRGEAYHQLRRAVASVNGNRFRGISDYEIDLWNECARLLTNAIIYFNSKILSLLLTYFGRRGDDKNLELAKLIMRNWDDILRCMTTIKLRYSSDSQLFKRLSSYASDHPLYKALKEFGRLIKTQFILTYYDYLELHQRIEKQLNKVELANRFSKAVFFANNQEFQHGSREEQEIATGCKVLIQNAIVLLNTLFLSQRLSSTSNTDEQREMLNAIISGSLLTWQHVNLQGEYDFRQIAANEEPFYMRKIMALNLP